MHFAQAASRPRPRQRRAGLGARLFALAVGALAVGLAALARPRAASVTAFTEADTTSSFGAWSQRAREPLTPETVAEAVRALGGQVARLAAFSALPLRVSMARATASLLFPLSRRLLAAATPAPAGAVAGLERACAALNVTFQCPSLLVLERERGREMQTLPTGLGGLRFATFVSGGLLVTASAAELSALLAREVALLKMYFVRVPELWLLLQALQRRSQTKNSRRPKGLKTVQRESETSAVGRVLVGAVRQFTELCRFHHGFRLLGSQARQLPLLIEAPLQSAARRLSLPWYLGIPADAVAVNDEQGGLPALQFVAQNSGEIDAHLQLRRLYRIAKLAKEVKPTKPAELSPKKVAKALRKVYRIGPERVENILSFLARLRHPRLAVTPRRGGRGGKGFGLPHVDAMLLALLAAQRQVELLADRDAAQVVGDVSLVIGGLVLLHGTPTDRRRLARGELRGLILDGQAEEVPRRRWLRWWTSAAQLRLRPPLQLRIAELANWAASPEGQRRLGVRRLGARTWKEWLRSLPSRLWQAILALLPSKLRSKLP